MFFDGWTGLARVVIVGPIAYLALVIILRTSGKRTLSKLNAFDLVVTVALGSTLATILLSETVALAEGVLGLALLVALQYAIAWLTVRSRTFRGFVKSEPSVLLLRGQFIESAMSQERITRPEIEAALRSEGLGEPSLALAVVLETDGTLSVVRQGSGGLPASEGTSNPAEASRFNAERAP